jgi:hypothetical protein
VRSLFAWLFSWFRAPQPPEPSGPNYVIAYLGDADTMYVSHRVLKSHPDWCGVPDEWTFVTSLDEASLFVNVSSAIRVLCRMPKIEGRTFSVRSLDDALQLAITDAGKKVIEACERVEAAKAEVAAKPKTELEVIAEGYSGHVAEFGNFIEIDGPIGFAGMDLSGEKPWPDVVRGKQPERLPPRVDPMAPPADFSPTQTAVYARVLAWFTEEMRQHLFRRGGFTAFRDAVVEVTNAVIVAHEQELLIEMRDVGSARKRISKVADDLIAKLRSAEVS